MTDDYSALSAVYDALNGDLDYEGWADYLDREIRAHADIPVKLVLDLCCGTGTMTLALDRRGYDMTGVDREHFQTINALASYVEEHVEQ